ncbi:hypothetical protein QTP70_005329 [Hemibagrus guttatus]|uniref:Uncharacterized protein n=1 Tax=Hemibagrus guttatus TaxID=175788 RepID=A0AAE0PPJ1_9TELE|nr:hypothetical protein QTP70_005329 [Hemibagrus guttatus]
MQGSLQKWYDMKTIWDKYLNIKEHKALLAKMPPIKAGSKPKPPVPVRPPPYNSGDDEVYVDVLPRKRPGGKSTPNVAAPSVMSSKGKTVGASAPGIPSSRDDDSEPLSEEDEGLRTDGPYTGSAIDPPSLKSTNAACIFTVQGGGKPTIYSPSASDLKDILDLLPNPKDNPIHFVKTLIQTTRNAQLCGADYKFILMTKMSPMYDEDELVAKVAILDPKHDTPEVIQLTPTAPSTSAE